MDDQNGNRVADVAHECACAAGVVVDPILEVAEDKLDDQLPPMSSYALSDEQHRRAFLFHYCWVGEPALFEAVSHVWASLAEPREARCTLMGLMSGSGGTGKKGLVLMLKKLLAEALAIDNPIPDISAYDSLDEWHQTAMAAFAAEEEQLRELCARYSAILDGSATVTDVQTGSVIAGPWGSVAPC